MRTSQLVDRNAIVTIADERFLPAACCTLVSTKGQLPADRQVELILVATDVSETEVGKASEFLASHDIDARIMTVDSSEMLRGDLSVNDRLPISSYMRLRLDTLLGPDFDKVLYLDADTRVMAPLAPLFETELGDLPLAAVKDIYMYVQERLVPLNRRLGSPDETDYFNSGVMLLNWPVVLRRRILSGALEFAQKFPERCKTNDQDALNVVVRGRFVPVDVRWNLIHYYYLNGGTRQAWIKHYTGEKPWSARRPHIWREDAEWFREVLRQSPWPQFVARRTPITRFRARDVRSRIRNYNRVLGSMLVPFLLSSSAKVRANRFRQFSPQNVVTTAHSWMEHHNER